MLAQYTMLDKEEERLVSKKKMKKMPVLTSSAGKFGRVAGETEKYQPSQAAHLMLGLIEIYAPNLYLNRKKWRCSPNCATTPTHMIVTKRRRMLDNYHI